MTLTELACLFNLVGVVVELFISLFVTWRYPAPFFREWTKVYLCAVGMMSIEVVALFAGRNPALDLAEIALIFAACSYVIHTGLRLRERELDVRRHLAAPLVAVGYGLVARAAGLSFPAAVGPIVLLYSGAHAWLGWQFHRHGQETGSRASTRWLSVPLLLLGTWLFTYPVLLTMTELWVGYMVSGVFTIVVGTGMVAFVIEKAAEGLRASHEALVELDALKTNFIRVMSHELRTPLSSINTAAYLMTTGGLEPLSERQAEVMGVISANSKLLNRLVVDILDFSRMEAGAMGYERHEDDLADVAAASVRSLAPEYAKKGVALALEAPDARVPVEMDRLRMTQVLTNLLVNALKFTPTGGAVVVRVAAGIGAARVEVADTGVGIAAAEVARIFEKFYQVDGTATRQAGGLGLGLAIAKSIVEDGHGGRLGVTSEPGRGSTFMVELPADDQPAAAGCLVGVGG